jgi:hypothetical protein
MKTEYITSKHYRDWVSDTAKKAKEYRKREEAKRVGICYVLTALIFVCGIGFCTPMIWSKLSSPVSSLISDFNPNKQTIANRSPDSPVKRVIVSGPHGKGMSAAVRMLQGSGYEVVKNTASEDYYKVHGDVSFGSSSLGELINFLNNLEK